jgi:hypothetical protein
MPRPKKKASEVLGATLGLRLTAEEAERLDALVRRLPFSSRHAMARALLRIGLEVVEAEPSRLLRVPTRGPERMGRPPKPRREHDRPGQPRKPRKDG